MINYSLYLVTDQQLCQPQDLPSVVTSLVNHGINCVQLRMKDKSAAEVATTGKALLRILKPHDIKLIINDHLQVAKQINADGVHLGQKDSSIIKAREILGKEKIIGLSIENFAQAKRFATADVDYFGVGPIFSTTTKPDAATPIGIRALQDIRSIIDKPIVAIGGIDHKNAVEVLHAGADGIAVVSAILAQTDRVKACAKLHNIIKRLKMNHEKPCVLSIATADSSGGAGTQADIKAISATGSYAATVIALLTAQNTTAVTDIYALPLDIISAQIDAVFSDLKVKAVKIGMLYSKEIMLHVKERLHYWQTKNIVLDPVMIAQTGAQLIDKPAIVTLKSLFPIATLITPNIPEASFLLEQSINNVAEMTAAAEKLGQQYQTNVLLKGGHLTDDECCDILFNTTTGEITPFTSTRINTQNTHGTGCTLSSAIASFLAQGKTLETAIAEAKQYLHAAIDAGANWQLGHGYGPVDHFFNIRN